MEDASSLNYGITADSHVSLAELHRIYRCTKPIKHWLPRGLTRLWRRLGEVFTELVSVKIMFNQSSNRPNDAAQKVQA